jgi:hypothetical protein
VTGGERESDPTEAETEAERLARNLQELLGELRVALPGVQVLFAFLLTVPFTQRFADVTAFQERIYFATLLCTAVASALLIAPSAHHRIQFRHRGRREIIDTANKLTIAGLTFLAFAMAGVVLLVTDVLYGGTAAAVATSLMALLLAVVWYAIPLRRRFRRRS